MIKNILEYKQQKKKLLNYNKNYYDLNKSVIDDANYDLLKKELIEIVNIDIITNDSISNMQKSIFVKGYNKEIDDIDSSISKINYNIIK